MSSPSRAAGPLSTRSEDSAWRFFSRFAGRWTCSRAAVFARRRAEAGRRSAGCRPDAARAETAGGPGVFPSEGKEAAIDAR